MLSAPRMRSQALTTLVALSLGAAPALAEPGPAQALTPEEVEAIRADVRRKLASELRESLAADVRAATENAPPPSPFDAERFKWDEPESHGLGFLDFDGYLRFRYSLFENLALGTYAADADGGPVGPFAPGSGAPPVPLCTTDPACNAARGEDKTLAGANLRFRLEPTLEVYEDVRIRTQIDVFDRLVLGSTPDGFPRNDSVPLLGFSQSQMPQSDGINALEDSIRVKRAWAEIITSLGQIRVGRMPSHFGLGLLTSSGSDLDANDGDTVDRLMFATRLGDYYVMPAFEWGASGPTSARTSDPFGQPFDRDQRDDVDRYVLIVAKGDAERREEAARARGETVLSYGFFAMYETQAIEATAYDVEDASTVDELVARDGELFFGSAWGRLLVDDLRLEAELVGQFGTIASQWDKGFSPRQVDVFTLGAAATAEYKLLGDSLTLRLLVAAASGDAAPGFGVRTRARDRAPAAGDFDGPQDADGEITNYRFNPDFRVDRILFRQLIGAVTDALVIRPGAQYDIVRGFGVRLDCVYSQAMLAVSTPSGSFDPAHPLGVELDAKVFYENDDFVAALEYGLLFPLAGLDAQITRNGAKEVLAASAAQTLEATLAVTF
ncbi:MAG: TIGR04551 family protein [Deltaproteobacteria bacterium]|nr:TIGR04551 family protein [Deltaproteobacteria bacterium]